MQVYLAFTLEFLFKTDFSHCFAFQNGLTYFTMPNFGLGYILLNTKLDYEALYQSSATQFMVQVIARVRDFACF